MSGRALFVLPVVFLLLLSACGPDTETLMADAVALEAEIKQLTEERDRARESLDGPKSALALQNAVASLQEKDGLRIAARDTRNKAQQEYDAHPAVAAYNDLEERLEAKIAALDAILDDLDRLEGRE